MSRQQLHEVIDQQIPSDNLFCALRIDGHFRHAHTRTVPRQTPPYRAMTDVLDDQPVFRFNQREGAGRLPDPAAYAGSTSPGITSTLLPMTAKAAVTCWITSSTMGADLRRNSS